MKNKIILHYFLLTILNAATFSLKTHCNNQKECAVLKEKIGHKETGYTLLKCLLTDKSRLRFNKSFEKIIDGKNCDKVDLIDIDKILLRPKNQGSIRLERGMIDLEDLIGFERMLNFNISAFEIQLFKGFELHLYDDSIWTNQTESDFDYLKQIGTMYLKFSTLNFYHREKKLTTCKQFIEAANSTNPRSLFQIISKISNRGIFSLEDINKNKLCPLIFKDFHMNLLHIIGENSFYYQRILSFSNDTIKDLNSTIFELESYVSNVELNTDFLHPDVFKELIILRISTDTKKIQPDLFIWLNKVHYIEIKNEIIRRLMHNSGIEWIKNMNKDVNCNFENLDEYCNRDVRYISFGCIKHPDSPSLIDMFPDEDFCLYKDFPVNQLVTIFENCGNLQFGSGILNDKIYIFGLQDHINI